MFWSLKFGASLMLEAWMLVLIPANFISFFCYLPSLSHSATFGGMRPVRILGIYLLVVFLGGALLAPLLYWLAQSFASDLAKIAHSPFHRFVSRSVEALALIGLWPLFQGLGAKSLREVGLVSPKRHEKELGGGLALGFFSLALVAGTALVCGQRVIDATPGGLGRKLAGAALTAVVVAVLEEVLFRGALFGALRKGLHWMTALLLSSMIYALVHFLQSASASGPVHWYSGLEVLPEMLGGFANLHELVPGFFTLTLAGIVLGLAYQRTGNLYFSMGLHAGWIFWRKSYGIVTRPCAGGHEWFWGSGKLFDGWLALVVMAGTLFLFERWTRGKAPRTKHQAPEKSQAPSTNPCSDGRLGIWCLVLLWCLVLGSWCFRL